VREVDALTDERLYLAGGPGNHHDFAFQPVLLEQSQILDGPHRDLKARESGVPDHVAFLGDEVCWQQDK
jgi:hypothetical protein